LLSTRVDRRHPELISCVIGWIRPRALVKPVVNAGAKLTVAELKAELADDHAGNRPPSTGITAPAGP
jgi:hypothetical protein